MSARTVRVLRRAVGDPRVQHRYWSKVHRAGPDACWFWTGAIHPHGHGRFWLATVKLSPGRRRDVAVIAHRFAWALAYGPASLDRAPVLAHTCDEASCQNPAHLQAGTVDSNYGDWLWRRGCLASPLRDVRGPAGRARAIREAILAGGTLEQVEAARQAGVPGVDERQLVLW